MNQLTSILWLSVFFQIVAVVLALWLIPVSKKALAWLALSFAFLLMTLRRSISLLHQEGYIQNDWLAAFSSEIVALIISLFIVIGVYLIRDIFLQRNKSEAELSQIMAITGEGLWNWDVKRGIVSHNTRWCTIFGLTDDYLEHPLKDFTERLHKDDRETVMMKIQDCMDNKIAYQSEHRMLYADGSVIWVEDRGDVIERDPAGKPLRMLGSVTDITQRKLVEQELYSKAKIIDQIHDSVISTDLNGIVTSWNKGAKRLFGYTSDEMLGKHISLVYPEEEHAFLQNKVIAPLQEKGVHEVEVKMRRKSGNDFYAHLSLTMNNDEECGAIGMIGYSVDITERKQAEQKLQQFKNTLDQTLDCVFMFDADKMLFTYVNEGALQQVGYTREEMFGMHPYDIKPEFTEVQFREMVVSLISGDRISLNFETVHQHKNGKCVPVDIFLQFIKQENDSAHFVAIVRDIRERKEAEEALKEASELSNRIINESPIGIAIYDTTGQCIVANASIANIVGSTPDRLLEQNYNKLESWKKSGLLDAANKSILLQQKEREEFEVNTTFGKHAFFDCLFVPFKISDEQHLLLMLDDITENVYVETELENYRDHLEAEVIQRTADLSTARDEAERANQAKSKFLSRMSHELRTPMNAILGFGQILQLDAEELSESQRNDVKEILDAGHHLLNLINEVLDLAKIESGKLEISMEEVHIDDLLQQCLPLIKPQAKAHQVELTNNINKKGYVVQADFTRLKQVLVNLLSNAVKYNRKQGHITLDSKIVNKQRLQICVTDSGFGLTGEDISKLFTPFERLNAKTNVEGTGIGLVITKNLIEHMGGSIFVESTPGEGSSFCVELNLVQPLFNNV